MYGVQTSYIDMRQNRVEAHPESVLLALQALGASTRQMDDVPQALKAKREDLQSRAAEPVIVAWDGRLHSESLRQPANSKVTLVLEDATNSEWPPRDALPHGYHSLHIASAEGTSTSLVISAPVQAHFPLTEKAWGTFAPLYALHSDTTAGAGDLADLRSLIDWTREHAGRVVSTLPLLAAYLEGDRFEPSPYSPVSRLFWNEFYIDLSAYGMRPAAVPELIDYRTTMQEKRRLLEELARTFFADTGAPLFAEFQRFVREDPEVAEYARFRSRLENGENSEQYYLYAQWLVQTQLRDIADDANRTGMLLYLDLPLGLHRDSFDAWRYPKLFVKGISGGAPPDPVFTTGQNWSFQPIHPQAMRADGYRYAIAYIRNHLQYAKLLRIDHVMGLHRLFWIPDGLTGDQGLYVEYPADEMYAILSLESHRAGAGIVGENLGVVPPVVNESMSRHNVRQLYVAQYETALDSGPEALRAPPAGSVASLNTHDLFPFQGFLNGTDIDERRRLKFITAEEAAAEHRERERIREALSRFAGQNAFEGCIEFLAKSQADIVLLNLEDLWGETQAQNVPATTKEHPNWKRRMRYSIERLRGLALPQGLMKRGITDVTSQRS